LSDTIGSAVGLIGLGIMGSAMSKNLIAAGFSVIGYDVRNAAMKALSKIGGRTVGSSAEVALAADIIISLPAPNALFDIVAEFEKLPKAERLVIETSTFKLEDKEAARQRLGESGIIMLDCPLSGSGVQALDRDVVVYGSGDKAAYDRCLPVLIGFSRAPHYLGPFGNGSKMKYVANLIVAVHTAVAGEAFALARKAGLDPQQVFDVVSDGAAGSRVLDVRGSMLIADDYRTIKTMPLDLWRKDMRIIADFANSLDCPTPMFSAAGPLFNAAVASGLGDQDTAAVAAVIEVMAGLSRKTS
jgi:3-hydroxyisobutyrate dehydrogenase-like beta-hydroxyacid dehydrogenase